MPQPLSSVALNASILLGNVGDYPLQRHPELAMLVAEVIVSWGNVESFLLNLFIELMGGPKEKAATVFLSLESRSARAAAIRSVAELLPDDQKNLLFAILAIAKSNGKSRDKIAHHTWGNSPDIPDALLLFNPKDGLGPHFDNSNIFVYRKEDFTKIIKANERLAGFGQLLKFTLNDHVANKDGKLCDELCKEPEIAEQLRRLNQDNKTRPPK